MSPYTVNKIYAVDDFTSLNEHNARTPTTFFNAQPVLHLHCSDAKITSTAAVLHEHAAVFNAIKSSPEVELDPGSIVQIADIDVWVTSKFLALSSKATGKSVQIEYPSISVHGQQQDSVMLELIFSDEEVMPGEDIDFAQVNIFTSDQAASLANSDINTDNASTNGHGDLSAKLFQAIGDCQELNPDPQSIDGDSDEEASFMPTGSSFITAENMDQFMDADGNFVMPAQLGEGAGHIRNADELDDGMNAEQENEDDGTKWQRTNGSIQ